MQYVLVRHKVNDYSKWKTAFDDFVDIRRDGGEKSYQIFHPDGDPNNLILLFKWDSLENARKFMQSDKLKEAMQKAGVAEQPDIHFLEEVEKGTL
jgi:quinol monooxygenase YgiN